MGSGSDQNAAFWRTNVKYVLRLTFIFGVYISIRKEISWFGI